MHNADRDAHHVPAGTELTAKERREHKTDSPSLLCGFASSRSKIVPEKSIVAGQCLREHKTDSNPQNTSCSSSLRVYSPSRKALAHQLDDALARAATAGLDVDLLWSVFEMRLIQADSGSHQV